MATLASLLVRLGVDTRDVRSGLDKGTRDIQAAGGRSGRRFSKAFSASVTGGLAAAGIAGLVVAAFGQVRQAVDAASDLNETISKSQQIFGDAAGAVDAFARRAADSIGQSRQQALDAASTFAIFGRSAGLTGTNLVGFATDFTRLASDLASFNNTTPQDAIEAIGAALRGESEPIRRYGVLLDDATLRQEALALGLVKTTSQALTPQQKVLAAQAAIMKQTSLAQGDFARTADQNANAQRIQQARLADLRAELGSRLLPIQLQVTKAFAALAGFIGDNINVIGPLVAVIAGLVAVIKVWTLVQTALNLAMMLNPIGLIIIAVAALIAIIVLIATKTDFFQRLWGAAWGGIKAAAQAVAGWFAGPFAGFFVRTWQAINGGITATKDRIVNQFTAIVGFVAGMPGRIAAAAAGMWDGIRTAFRAAVNWIIDGWNRLRFRLPAINVPFLGRFGGFTLGVPHIPRLHTGGVVPGPPGSETLAVLQAGEQVLPARQPTTVIEIRSGGSRLDEALIDLLARAIQVRGGNVELVLAGRTGR